MSNISFLACSFKDDFKDVKEIYFWELFYLMRIIILYIIALLICGCANYEEIGIFRYKIKIEKVNTGDYDGIINSIKTYNIGNEFQAGCILKSQKLGFEKATDSVFSKGTTIIDKKNKTLTCKKYYFFGYKEYLRKDSVITVFKQQPDGKLKLALYKENNKNAILNMDSVTQKFEKTDL